MITDSNDRDVQELRRMGRVWDALVAARDLDGLMGLFARDAQSLADNTPPAIGEEAVRGLWGHVLATPGLEFTTEDQLVAVADSRDLAYVIGRAKFAFDTPDGRFEDDAKYLLVWKRVDGAWKLAADMNNSNVPLQ